MDADKAHGEKFWTELYKNAAIYIEKILETSSHEIAAIRSPTSQI